MCIIPKKNIAHMGPGHLVFCVVVLFLRLSVHNKHIIWSIDILESEQQDVWLRLRFNETDGKNPLCRWQNFCCCVHCPNAHFTYIYIIDIYSHWVVSICAFCIALFYSVQNQMWERYRQNSRPFPDHLFTIAALRFCVHIFVYLKKPKKVTDSSNFTICTTYLRDPFFRFFVEDMNYFLLWSW